ncbi:MAG TPA: Crp/Fnr family transcriptional regulator [Actinophytocola sp.]|uniref:Crp/Fnr family transcriptional regulator n=1 Tax=Actinophytocola sp. TaxID=1872138 RepID=UPI002DDD912F|nr:Crp/Fnr family transcriptional regulator [Actinophytocola sp.]HEV2782308.1 Crp/Fnr family transcriptional regulator [Actinophytocola sp.]
MEDHRGSATGSLLTYLEPADREFLFSRSLRRSYRAGELLLHQGDPSNHVLVIVSGWVRVYCSTSDGHDFLFTLRGPGDLIGELAALGGWPRMGTVQTLESVTAMQLIQEQFAACLRERPSIAMSLIKLMSERLREANAMMVEIATLDVPRRVAACLWRLIQQHGVRERGEFVLRIPLTQRDIANRIGASPRAVARSLATLRKRRIVATHPHRIVVADLEALSRFARPE